MKTGATGPRGILPLLFLLLPAGFAPAEADPPWGTSPSVGASSSAGPSPSIRTFSVRKEPVEQVLLAFAERTGISIVTDSTVSGSVSIVLHDTDPFDTVMHLARAANLLVEDRGGVLWMSRVLLRAAGADRWTLRSSGARADEVIRAAARATGRPIQLQADLRDPVDLVLEALPLKELLNRLCAPLGATVKEQGAGFLITRREETHPAVERITPREVRLFPEMDGTGQPVFFHLTARQTTAAAILDHLFEARSDHYYAAAPLSSPVTSLDLSAPDLDELWHRLVTVLNLHVLRDGDSWAVVPAGQEQRLLRFRSRAVVTLRNRPAEQIAEVLGRLPDLEVQALDHYRNVLVLRALPATLQEALDLTSILESERGGTKTAVVPLAWADPEETVAALRHRFPEAVFSVHREREEIVLRAPEERIPEILDALPALDRPRRTHLYPVRHLTPDELVAAAGADHGLDQLLAAGDGQSIYLRGAAGSVRLVTELFTHLDRPREQLRFDLCIIQHQNSTSRHRGTQASLRREGSTIGVFETTWDATARFDQLLSLQFDLLSALGYQAALALSGELSDNSARVVVDTSLRARDGDTVTLENASTYRYRDYLESDAPEGTQGITREIDSGLEVELRGRYHRDRSVTVTVRVSLSKQGADLSGRGNPPPTSRKVVETTVRVSAGEPVVIGGLLQQEQTGSSRRVPLLGRVPLLRRILASESGTREETEMVLYLSVFPERTEHPRERQLRQTSRLRELHKHVAGEHFHAP